MKKSNFLAGILFLAAMAMFRLAFAQAGLTYAIVMDSSGNIIGQLAGNGLGDITPVDATLVDVQVRTRTSAPPGVTMSSQAPAFTASPSTAKVRVPASTLVGFCSSGDVYNKATGLCADGKFPYKIVPTGSLSDPAAQTPTIVCRAPMVPTYNPAMKKWLCIVPTGFKATLGE